MAHMDLLMGVITGIRNIRGEMRIPPSTLVRVVMDVPDKESGGVVLENAIYLKSLAKVAEFSIQSHAAKPEASATAVFKEIQIHVLLKGLLDFEEEKRRIGKEIAKLEKELGLSNKKLANADFLEKAPAQIVEEVREKVSNLTGKLEKLHQNLDFFSGVEG